MRCGWGAVVRGWVDRVVPTGPAGPTGTGWSCWNRSGPERSCCERCFGPALLRLALRPPPRRCASARSIITSDADTAMAIARRSRRRLSLNPLAILIIAYLRSLGEPLHARRRPASLERRARRQTMDRVPSRVRRDSCCGEPSTCLYVTTTLRNSGSSPMSIHNCQSTCSPRNNK